MIKTERSNLGDEILRDNYYDVIEIKHMDDYENSIILLKNNNEYFLTPKNDINIPGVYKIKTYVSRTGKSWSNTFIYSTFSFKKITPININTNNWYKVFLNENGYLYLYEYQTNYYEFKRIDSDKVYRFKNQFIIPKSLKGKNLHYRNIVLYNDGEKYLIGKYRKCSYGRYFHILSNNIPEFYWPNCIVSNESDIEILRDKEVRILLDEDIIEIKKEV